MISSADLQAIESSVRGQLDEFATTPRGSSSVQVDFGRSRLQADVSSVDRLACEVKLFSAHHPRFGSLSTELLHKIADEVAGTLTYLEEGLRVLEVDSLAWQVQLRSSDPLISDHAISYFEAHVGRTGICLRRFRKQDRKRRDVVSAVVTRDIFCRVSRDLLAICAGRD